MDSAIGLSLLGLVFYTSILSYGLRHYSRARLSERLPPAARRTWLEWLDRCESELQLVAATLRLTFMVALAWWVLAGRLIGPGPVTHARLAGPLAGVLALWLLAAVIVPHSVAVHAGEAVLARSLRVLRAGRVLLYPLLRTAAAVDFVIRRLAGRADAAQESETERVEQEILEAVSEGEAHGAVDEEQRQMIRSIFELHETTVAEIMTPRTDIVAVEAGADYEQVRRIVLERGHSRIPVYEGSLDHIIGVVYAKDLLRLRNGEEFDLRRLMRPVPYVPEAKTIDELLREFRQNRVHVAIVLDEYGGTAGLVTIEDILEELVGEIDDEYDRTPPPAIQQIDEATLEVDARVHVHELNEKFDLQLPEDGDYETIGGFVFFRLGRIPQKGESLVHGNLRIRVLEAEPRRIHRLRLERIGAAERV